ncbi:MAG: tetratricopeptide repeat protein [Sedimentisphaerales bacterium]|nr:tetratricopeptide repeat protein [Sedimentisphaerales bacterium]
MAKRLNKKVAIISSLFLAVLIVVAIVIILNISKDPHKYIADAEAILSQAEPDYEAARRAYGQAFGNTKDIDLKIDILFKLADMYKEINEWPKVVGCWNNIVNYDPKNEKARLALLDYSYQLAETGSWMTWTDVESNASELIAKELDTSPRMYRMKGQALVELVKRGQKTDTETAIKDAIENLQKAREMEPNNVDVYAYLADAIIEQGKITAAKGILGAAENAQVEAEKILLDGIENLPDEPKAYVNLYHTRLAETRNNPDKYKELESDIINLVEKFDSSPLPLFTLVQLYQVSPKDTDKAIAAIERARELDKQDVSYAVSAASLYYRRYSIYKNEDDFRKGIEIAKEALTYPDSLDIPGPNDRKSFINRYVLHTFLINCFIEKAIKTSENDPEKAKWLESAEKELYELDQLLGSAENAYAIMWRGRLLLAQGQTDEAIVQMNTAYEMLTAASRKQGEVYLGELSYELAKALHNSPETGAVIKFYSTAIQNGLHYSKPEVLLDFASALMITKNWSHILESVDFYEKNFTVNNKSRILRIGACIGTSMFDEAQELLKELPPEDPNRLKLEITLLNNKLARINWRLIEDANAQETQMHDKLMSEQTDIEKKRNSLMDKLSSLGADKLQENQAAELCKKYISDGKYDNARKLAEDFGHVNPNSVNVKIYRFIADEPEPANVSPERFDQLMIKAIETLDDPVRKALLLGKFYRDKEQPDKASEYFQQVLKLDPANNSAVAYLFDIAVTNKDFEKAEELIKIAQENNTDRCAGEFFKAQLAFTKGEYKRTAERIDNALEKRPIFSQAYLLRSKVNTMLEKDDDAIADLRKAQELNPLDNTISRSLAYLLYKRNEKLGISVSVEQQVEARNAIESAIRANPSDFQLKSFYAEYIGDTDPVTAISVCQKIQKVSPSVENSLILGRLAWKIAEESKVESQKKMYFSIAEDAYKTAYEFAPTDMKVLTAYSEFLKSVDKPQEAENILANQESILWRFYLRDGKFEEGEKVLQKLYEANPNDPNTIKGLLIIARNKKDQAEILKYVGELIKHDNSIDNQIIQIESYLETGLTDDAQAKLDSLRERYPDEPRAIFLKAWLLARQGKLEEALKLTNRTLELDENNARAWRLRGQINIGMNNLNAAIDDLQKSKTLQDEPEVRIDLARAYIRSGKQEQAIVELKVAVNEQGSSVARNMLEEVYYITGKKERLEEFYADVIKEFPQDVHWYNRAGQFALNNGNFTMAYNFFDTALQNSLKINNELPDIEAFDGKMISLLSEQKYDQILTEAAKYLDSSLAPIAYARMAAVKARMGDMDSAVQYYRRSLEKVGMNETYLIEILKNMTQVVGSDETMKWCNEKLQSQPDSLAVNLAMFNLCKLTGDYDKAIEYIDNCIRISADDAKLSVSYKFNKATTLQGMFDMTSNKTYLERAVKEYESLHQKLPTNTTLLNNLAYTLASTNTDLEKALGYAEKAYKALPNNANVLDTYGYVLFKNDQVEKSDEILQRALQQYEQNKMNAPIEVYEHIGMTKEKLGQDTEALQAYRRAIEFAGQNISQDVKNRILAAIERIASKQ